jgi:hypothetical protein
MAEDALIYNNFEISGDRQRVSFLYNLSRGTDKYDFVESLEFPLPLLDTPAQQAALRALHLALGVSYYKLFLPGIIRYPYQMDASEAEFWNTVWRHGLSEFLYVNRLPVDRLAKFSPQDGTLFPPAQDNSAVPADGLLGIGGGKDSIVAREVLRDCGVALQGFVLATGEQLGQTSAVADIMAVPLLAVKRGLDKQLLAVQEQPGAYRGHIPISLIFGLVGMALACATGKKYVIVGNEASASVPHTTWGDMLVNHQWSKSLDFEKMLQRYAADYIDPQLSYFSPIRQLTSVGVAKLFSRYRAYYEVFTSDNSVFRIDPARRPTGRWSKDSPKSLSSFILLAPWIEESDMLRIFSANLLDDLALEQLFARLIGVEEHPPLDCVGTVEEMVLSLNLMAEQGKFKTSRLCDFARRKGVITDKDWQPELARLSSLQTDQALPSPLKDKITNRLQEELAL